MRLQNETEVIEVVVKVHKEDDKSDEFTNEYEIGLTLMNVSHENVVKLYNFIFTEIRFYLVFEFCNQGNLNRLLKKSNHAKQQLLTWASEIAQGMLYLKQFRILHRDLALRNILVHNGIAKIGDFGLARVKYLFQHFAIYFSQLVVVCIYEFYYTMLEFINPYNYNKIELHTIVI